MPHPLAYPGQRIGLMGGSFNPPHAAHRAASLFAWKRLGLDRVWWLVTPGNPLKPAEDLAPLEERVAQARARAASPVIDATDIEASLGTRYSYDTVARLQTAHPSVRFVFIMGADILAEFHLWRRWQALAARIPLAFVDRDGWTEKALASPAAQWLSRYRMPEREAMLLPRRRPPAWVFLTGLKLKQSSTALRRKG
jgi:nicotinate-nucleotide adenylyltransferase